MHALSRCGYDPLYWEGLDSHLAHSEFTTGFSYVERLIKVRANVALEFLSVDCPSRCQSSSPTLRSGCRVACLVLFGLRVKTNLPRFDHGFSVSLLSSGLPT